jgi:hypothetical protein
MCSFIIRTRPLRIACVQSEYMLEIGSNAIVYSQLRLVVVDSVHYTKDLLATFKKWHKRKNTKRT